MADEAHTMFHLSEPRLRELLDDPLVHQVMARDGVAPAEVLALVQSVAAQRRVARCPEPCAA